MEQKEILAEISGLEKELEEVKGTECEVYSRVVGYFRPVKQWNDGKREEFKDRKVFEVDYSAQKTQAV